MPIRYWCSNSLKRPVLNLNRVVFSLLVSCGHASLSGGLCLFFHVFVNMFLITLALLYGTGGLFSSLPALANLWLPVVSSFLRRWVAVNSALLLETDRAGIDRQVKEPSG